MTDTAKTTDPYVAANERAREAFERQNQQPAHEPTPAPYVIINDIDGPYFRMICQWVPGVGYCYLDRGKTKPRHDGMSGDEATPVEAFGIVWTDNSDGTVSFYRSERPVTATYRDGQPRRWHDGADSAEYRRLTRSGVTRKARAHA